MKKNIFPLLIFFCLSGFSQNTELLKKSAQELYEANYLMDFETIASLSYPDMVTKIGKTTFLEQTEQHYENEQYRLRYQLPMVPFQLGIVKKINEKSFCVITIRIPKRYFFENKLTAEQAATQKTWLQEVNNTKDVTFEPNRNSFNVKMISTLVAVADQSTGNEWRFFNLDMPSQKEAFQELIDESVRRQLGLK